MKTTEKQNYYLTEFVMLNTRINVPKLVEELVWVKRYKYFELMYQTMDNTNKINFSALELTEITEKRIRSLFHKVWIIRKCKLDEDIWYAWYMNPYLVNKDNKVNDVLLEVFSKNENTTKPDKQTKDLMDIIFK